MFECSAAKRECRACASFLRVTVQRIHRARIKGNLGFQVSIPASTMTKISLCIFVFLISNLQSPCEAAETPSHSQHHDLSRIARNVDVADEIPQSNMTGFTVEYTLITANSPDCEPSLIDNFPVRVQYRTIIGSGDGGQSNNGVNEWMDSPNTPGIYPVFAS